MRIDVSKYGTVLLSRPAGREAFLVARAYANISKKSDDPIELDFSGVSVLTPSWADEFVRGLSEEFGAARVRVLEGEHVTVRQVFATLREVEQKRVQER